MEYLENPNDSGKALQYIHSLNFTRNYQEAYIISSEWISKYSSSGSYQGQKSDALLIQFWKNKSLVNLKINQNNSLKNTYIFEFIFFAFLFLVTMSDAYGQIFAKFLLNISDEYPILKKYIGADLTETNVEVSKEDEKVFFKDIIGIDEFKEELLEVVEFLKNPNKFSEVGAYIPKGFLICGKPGVGKTMLAKAVANESGCSFFFTSGSEFDQMFVGSGAKNIRNLFKRARKHQPAVIFIDEIDSVGAKRSDSMTNTLNQLLTEMDGFSQNEKIIVVAATNRADSLDPALVRPGRFDRKIDIPSPDIKGRTKMIEHYLSKISSDPKIDPEELAKKTSGFTGAMIASMVNLAITNAVYNHRNMADDRDFKSSLDRMMMGIHKKSYKVDKEFKLRTAVYQSGKSIASLMIEGSEPVYKATILPKGDKVQGTVTKPESDMVSINKKQLIARMKVLLAGRAAEQLFYDQGVSTRSEEDFQKASKLVMNYMRKMAMDEDVSLVSAEKKELSDSYNYLLEQKGTVILREVYNDTLKFVKKNKFQINQLSKQLVKVETMDKNEIKKFIGLS